MLTSEDIFKILVDILSISPHKLCAYGLHFKSRGKNLLPINPDDWSNNEPSFYEYATLTASLKSKFSSFTSLCFGINELLGYNIIFEITNALASNCYDYNVVPPFEWEQRLYNYFSNYSAAHGDRFHLSQYIEREDYYEDSGETRPYDLLYVEHTTEVLKHGPEKAGMPARNDAYSVEILNYTIKTNDEVPYELATYFEYYNVELTAAQKDYIAKNIGEKKSYMIDYRQYISENSGKILTKPHSVPDQAPDLKVGPAQCASNGNIEGQQFSANEISDSFPSPKLNVEQVTKILDQSGEKIPLLIVYENRTFTKRIRTVAPDYKTMFRYKKKPNVVSLYESEFGTSVRGTVCNVIIFSGNKRNPDSITSLSDLYRVIGIT